MTARNIVSPPGGSFYPRIIAYDSADIGQFPAGNGNTYGLVRLPGESIGVFSLTMTNVVIGSAIRIEIASTGALVEHRVADTTTEVFTLPAYSGGDANNDMRIKVRKGSSAPLYKPYETLATASVGAASVYIAQIPD